MKKIKDTVLLVSFCLALTLIASGNRRSGEIHQRVKFVYGMEALVMPPANTFSPDATAQLLRWIARQETKFDKDLRFPYWGLGQTDSIADALNRLNRCKDKLKESNMSNHAMKGIDAKRVKP